MFEPQYGCPRKRFKATYIDGKPYATVLPRAEQDLNSFDSYEFTSLINFMEGEDTLQELHCDGIATLSSTLAPLDIRLHPTVKIITIGGFKPGYRSDTPVELTSAYLGYRPVLIPLDPKTLEPDPGILAAEGHADGDLLTFGTLYAADLPVRNPKNPAPNGDIPSYLDARDMPLSIGDTYKNPEGHMHWFCMDGLLICDRVVLTDIPWLTLYQQGLVYGFVPGEQIDEADCSFTGPDAELYERILRISQEDLDSL